MRGWGPYPVIPKLKLVWRGVHLLAAAEKALYVGKQVGHTCFVWSGLQSIVTLEVVSLEQIMYSLPLFHSILFWRTDYLFS